MKGTIMAKRDLGIRGNRIMKVNIADNELNLNDLGYDGQELIDEMVELSHMTGVIWKYSEDAHRDYIMEKLSIDEILAECEDLGVDLEEYKEDEE